MIVSDDTVSKALASCRRCGARFKPQHNAPGYYCSNKCSAASRFPPLRERFAASFLPEPNSGCWIWTGTINRLGYGMVRDLGKSRTAHRVSYEIHNGNAHGLHVLHQCDMRCCVNPEHLFLGTHQDNMRDMARKGRSFNRWAAK